MIRPAASGFVALCVEQTLRSRIVDRCARAVPHGLRGQVSRVRTVLSFAAAFLLSGAVLVPARAQTTLLPGWSQQTPANSPPARYIHALTYDQAHGQVVLFGGYSGGNYVNDTWLWNGTTWTQANPATSPSPRAAEAMVYDAAHGQVVLFGGLASVSSRLGDTWLWNGTNWTQASPANSPPARDGAVMVYDAAHGQVVMFGGVNGNGAEINDTWLWNGSTWTQASPTASPSARADYSMAYDAALGEVVLFGGQVNGAYVNDTWVWNGSNWIQQSPAVSPSARYAHGMTYSDSLGQIVMFGGYNGNFLSDTWFYNGTTWTQANTGVYPLGRYAPNAVTYDSAHRQVVLFGGLGNTVENDTWEFGLPGNFGSVNVCPLGQTNPAPCSDTISFSYSIPNSTTFGSVQVLTQGSPALDFTLGSASTCKGAVAQGTCTVSAIFTPLAPGQRAGAIQLKDGSGNLLISTPIYGVGEGPATAFGPGAQTSVNTGNYPLQQPKGVTVDAAGDVFIADNGNSRVVEVAASGSASTVGFGLNYPQSLALDGAGDLFIADNNLNEVVEVPAGCTNSSCQQVLGANVRSQLGVAVDGAGDVFFGDFLDGEVLESPAGCTTSACQTVVYNPSGANPVGLAVDAAGDLFVADFGLREVVEVPSGCTSTACQIQIGQGWSQPEAIAVDAAGDVFVADESLYAIIEVPAGCTTSGCQTTILSGVYPIGVAVDAQGVLYIPDLYTNQVLELHRSQLPSLNFAATNVGSVSSDSPQSIFLQNIGNQLLTAGVVVGGPNFAQVAGAGTPVDCSPQFGLIPGAACNLSVSFDPSSGGNPVAGSAVFTDNALNFYGTQSISLNGVALAPSVPLTVTEIGSGSGTVTDNLGQVFCSEANGVNTGACAGTYPVGSVTTLTAVPTLTSKFLGWGGVCASSGTNLTCSVPISEAANATASFVDTNFGGINVCPAGQTALANCTATLPITFNLASSTTIGATQVVTQGVSGLDFALGSSTCVGTVAGGSACTVNVSFTPLAAGLRLGAIELFDKNANLVATTTVSGVGEEPQIAFGPGVQTLVNSKAYYPLSQPRGIAIDAAGDTFIADTGNHRVVKIAPNGIASTVGTGLSSPEGLAVDGAGNLLVADNVLNEVVNIPAGCASAACQKTVGVGLSGQAGVAVDGAGDVFIATPTSASVIEVPAGCTSSGCQTVVYSAVSGSDPVSVAVDAAGDLFVTDLGLERVMEVPAGCTSSACYIAIGQGWGSPQAVAVDAAGDVFVVDPANAGVVEVPAGCASTACQSTVFSGTVAVAVALDASGNLYIPEASSNQVVKLNRSQPPALSFYTTNAGSTSGDSPKSVTVQNVGNQPLAGSLAANLSGNFVQSLSPDCTSRFPLVPGATCGESFSFTPQSATFFLGAVVYTDNNSNVSGATQTITLSGTGAINGEAGLVAVPNLVGQAQTAVASPIAAAGLVTGTVTTASSSTVASGSVISQNPVAGTQVSVGSAVNLLVSSGQAQPNTPNPLSLNNNYFLTGDYVSAGVTLRGTGAGGIATGTITVPTYAQSATQGVPDGADIVDAFLYWETLENTPTASSANGTFNGYPITGQQIGNDLPNYTDGKFTGTIRAYRAEVNLYLPDGASGIRFAAGNYTVSLPDSGGTALPLTEGASLVLIYRVLSPNFPLKSVVIYDGSALPASPAVQLVQGFYDAVGGANGTGKNTNLFASGSTWNNSVNNAVTLGQASQYSAPLNPANAYAAVILSTPVNNSDNDGILDVWKAGPPSSDFHAGQPGYYDAKTGTWVGLPGAKRGQKDLFVQLDYMCGAILANGSCDPSQENLFPSPDANGNDPLAMVQEAFAASGVQLHLTIGNAVPESTCTDSPGNLCQFPNQPGVIGWKNSLEFSKLYPRNLVACLSGGDCTTRFPYGQKDSYHYVLFGHSLAIPAWNTRYATLTSIIVANGVTTIGTVDRGTGINACPSRITISGVLGNPSLNGVYNTTSCADTKTIALATPGVPSWSYPNNTLPEPVIGLTSGTISSISGYSDLGGADSAVTLGLWLTAPNQDMSKRANVLAGTLFHEIGHTLGLSHGGLYYDTPNSYVPTFDGNCKPNYQSVMNYLFQLDGVGLNHSVAFSNQALASINENTAGSITQLSDSAGNPATFTTSAWYVPYTTGSPVSAATLHCDGTPLNGEQGYRVDSSIAPISPAWSNGQDLSFTGGLQANERGYNDLASLDLRQVGATGGEFASLASILSFGSSAAPLNISAGGNVTLGSGGTVALGSGGTVTLGSGGNVTLGSGGTITLGSGGTVTLGSGGNVTLGSGGTVSPGSSGTVTLGSGGTVTLGSGGTITLGSGGTVTLGSGGTVTLGSGGTIALGSGGNVTIPSAGGSYSIDGNGGTVTLGSGGTVALGSGGTVALGSGGTIALGSGGTVTLGSGGTVTLGSGGTVALGSGGTVALGSGGNVTLGSGGTVTLGSGGTVTLGSGGTVTLGSGGTVTLGSGGTTALGSGGTVTLGSGGTATLGAGGTVTLGSGGTVTLGSGGNVTLGSGGTVTLGSGGTVTLGSGGTVTLGSGGTVTLGSGGAPITIGAGGTVTLGSGGTVTLGSGGTVALGSGGTVVLGSGGTVALGSGGTVTLGSGGTVTLGSGGVVTLGNGGSVSTGSGSDVSLGSVNNITSGSGGPTSTELTYETANSVVRPPTSPAEVSGSGVVTITWQAPAFGVVQTYTIDRSSNGATAIVIGSVSGVNGNPPATEFTDANPDLTSKSVVYTVTTTLVPDPAGPPRQSVPSVPALLKNGESISLGPLPSSVLITNPPTVTATAMSGGVPNGLQVVFSAVGSCSIGNSSLANNVTSATVTLAAAGSCTITASQPGSTAFTAANSVSGTFVVLPQGSGTKSQTIHFATLQNVQYGSSFALSATSSAGLPVSFTASGPCTTSGSVSGVGVCNITASAPGNSTVSAGSLTQSFNIYPAVLRVIASTLVSTYGQPVPALSYLYGGFVNGDTASVISGQPALSTPATATSNAGNYAITVSTGTLATTNYSFLYVSGTLTVQPANQSPLLLSTTSPLIFNQSETLHVTGGSSGGAVTYNATGSCTVSGALLTATSGSGTCLVTATMAGSGNYTPVTSTPANTVTLAPANETITFTANPPANAAYSSSFTVAATSTSGGALSYTSAGACGNSGATYNMTSGTGTCSVIVNQAGNANYSAAAQLTKTVSANLATPTVTFTGAPASALYKSGFTVAATTNASTPAVISSSGACSNAGGLVTMTSGTGTCALTATWAADSNYSSTRATQTTSAIPAAQAITFTLNPPVSAAYTSSFKVAATGGASANPVTFSSAGACSNSGATFTMTNSTGSCSVIASQAGNGNYAAATPVTKLVTATGPLLSVSPTAITFGTVYLGSITTHTVTLTNIGTGPVTITDPILSIVKGGNSNEFLAVSLCPKPLAIGKSCTVTIAFVAGPFYTQQTATLQIMSNAPGSPQAVALSATVINPLASLNTTGLKFGSVKHATSSTLTVTLSNPGTTTLSLTSIGVTGANSSAFVQSSNCGSSVAAGASCAIAVKFTPAAMGVFNANLTITDNARYGGTQTVPLSGTGN